MGHDYKITKESQSSNLKIIKPDNIDIEDCKTRDRGRFSIQFDHYLKIVTSRTQPLILLFDSKYFSNDVNAFNYKQAFYYYYLRGKYKDAIIRNALIIPTSGERRTVVHVDRQHIDGLYIREEYINLKDVIDYYNSIIS